MSTFVRNQEGFDQFRTKVYETYASVKPEVALNPELALNKLRNHPQGGSLDWDALAVYAWVERCPGVQERFPVPRGVQTPMFFEIWPIKRYTVTVENKFVEWVVQETW